MRKLSKIPVHLEKYRSGYIIEHSKFIHPSWCLKEDIDRVTVIDDVNWTIEGLWDSIGSRRIILLKNEQGSYAVEESKVVAQGMGYSFMRNLVTGKEHTTLIFNNSATTSKLKKVELEIPKADDEQKEDLQTDDSPVTDDENTSGVWDKVDEQHESEDGEEIVEKEESYIDPLVKALQDEISDE